MVGEQSSMERSLTARADIFDSLEWLLEVSNEGGGLGKGRELSRSRHWVFRHGYGVQNVCLALSVQKVVRTFDQRFVFAHHLRGFGY